MKLIRKIKQRQARKRHSLAQIWRLRQLEADAKRLQREAVAASYVEAWQSLAQVNLNPS